MFEWMLSYRNSSKIFLIEINGYIEDIYFMKYCVGISEISFTTLTFM